MLFNDACQQRKKKNFKSKLFAKAQDLILDHLDISKIVHKLEEAEKLKFVMLSPKQLAMFEFIPKQALSFNSSNQKESEITKLKNLYDD